MARPCFVMRHVNERIWTAFFVIHVYKQWGCGATDLNGVITAQKEGTDLSPMLAIPGI